MARFVISDTHAGHKNIVHLGVGRPAASIEDHDAMIVRRWNAVVAPGDTVYHLGDVALGQIEKSIRLVHLLNGYKILRPGNHDRIFAGAKAGQREKYEHLYQAVFQEIQYDEEPLFFAGRRVQMSHFPYDGDHTDADRWTEYRPVDDGLILLHGHTHSHEKVSRSAKGTLQVHVGVDAWNYAPVSEDEVAAVLDKEAPVVVG